MLTFSIANNFNTSQLNSTKDQLLYIMYYEVDFFLYNLSVSIYYSIRNYIAICHSSV